MIPFKSLMRVFSVLSIFALMIIFVSPTALAETLTIDTSSEKKVIFSMVNKEREAHDLKTVQASTKLDETAQKWAETLAERNILEHNSTYLADSGGWAYGWREVSENVGAGAKTGEEAMKNWLDSAGHKSNILGEYNRIGIGIASADDGTLYFVQNFGHAESSSALAVSNIYDEITEETQIPSPTETKVPEATQDKQEPTNNTTPKITDNKQNRAPLSENKPLQNTRATYPSYVSNLKGELEAITVDNHVMTVSGWAYDTGTSTPLSVFINIKSDEANFKEIEAIIKTDVDRKDIFKKFSNELSSSVVGINWSSPALPAGEYSVTVNTKNMRTNVASLLASKKIVINEEGSILSQVSEPLAAEKELAIEDNSSPLEKFIKDYAIWLLIASGVGFIGSIVGLILVMRKYGYID